MMDKKKLNKAMNNAKRPNVLQPSDPNMTMNVDNTKVEELMKLYATEKTGENLNQLVVAMREVRVLIPANLNEQKQPLPCKIKGPTGEMFLPIYTGKAQIPESPRSEAVINMPYLAINKIAANPDSGVAGIVINPFSDNLIFKMPLLQKIEEVEKLRKEGVPKKTMQLTPEQYVVFERKQFEFGFLPKRFFEQGRQMMDELCDKKEEYIDQLFEEAYQQKRMYPYLPEDFSVMVMNISEDLLLVRVDLPNKDMGVPSCWRVYLSWDNASGQGRYFTIERTQEKGVNMLGELGKDWKHLDHGQSPVEGAELARVLDLIQEETNE